MDKVLFGIYSADLQNLLILNFFFLMGGLIIDVVYDN